MINDLIKYFENKKILILGFGKEGQSTYKLIRKHLKEQKVYIADKKDISNLVEDDANVQVISGEGYLDNLEAYDIIMKSPGISFVGIDTSKYILKIKSQLELMLEFFDIYTIGITGTKGKSTTSSLIYKILKDQNKNVKLLGNIGTPVFECIDEIEDDMILVLEMSSHQLEYMEVSPNIAILLNVFEEHLDHYKSFEKYVDAKCNIYKYQKKTDYFIYNIDNEVLKNVVKNTNSKTYGISLKNNLKGDTIYFNNKAIYNKNENRKLKGDYNLSNIMFALSVCEIMNLDIKKATKTVSEFNTLEHRLELVGKYDGIYFYDNSIATIPMATIEAVEALKKVDTLIIGGMDRGISYKEFINYLNNSSIKNIICMPKTGHDIAKELKPEKTYLVETLEEAVRIAKNKTEKDGICLLSPAAASYGFFKNFEEKGNIYKQLVKGEK